MKKYPVVRLSFLVFIVMLIFCSKRNEEADVALATRYDTIGYLIGQDMVSSLYNVRHYITINSYIQGFRDEYLGNKLQLEPMAMQQVMGNYYRRKTQKENMKTDSIQQQFLQANNLQTDIIITASGLQYKILEEGSGLQPSLTDRVKIRYTGMFIDSVIFDSSEEPVIIQIDKVIKGWVEVLQLMKTGSKYKVYIPGELGFGRLYIADDTSNVMQQASQSVPDTVVDSINFWDSPEFKLADTTLCGPGIPDTLTNDSSKPVGLIIYEIELVEIM